MCGQVDGWMDGRMDGWMGRRVDGWMLTSIAVVTIV
jgi:hypothetical protein